MKVFVYFNLHKLCFSVKALEGPMKGRVVQHSNAVMLHDVTFKVSEAGRQRVLREKRKNVHAGVVGTLDTCKGLDAWRVCELASMIMPRVSYNPYKGGSFFVCGTGADVSKGSFAWLMVESGKGFVFASEAK